MAVEVTERKRAEEELRESQRLLERFVQERERLSRDLHDGIIQTIYALGMGIEDCQALIDEDPTRASAKLEQIIKAFNGVIEDIRLHILQLEPSSSLNGQQVRAEFTNLVETMTTPHLQFRLAIDVDEAISLNRQAFYHLHHIAREALSNSIRHSGATSGTLALEARGNSLRLEIKDNGMGFQVATAIQRGHGVRNMIARALLLGTTIDIMTQPGQGTCILLNVPGSAAYVLS